MSKSERRKIFCSVLFHLIAIVCMLWSVYILVKRTTEEIRLGKNGQCVPLHLLSQTRAMQAKIDISDHVLAVQFFQYIKM